MTDRQRDEKVAYLLKGMAHPLRLQILMVLANQPDLTILTIQQQLGIGQPLILRHLIGMRQRGVIVMRRQGKACFYSVAEGVFAQSARLLIGQATTK